MRTCCGSRWRPTAAASASAASAFPSIGHLHAGPRLAAIDMLPANTPDTRAGAGGRPRPHHRGRWVREKSTATPAGDAGSESPPCSQSQKYGRRMWRYSHLLRIRPAIPTADRYAVTMLRRSDALEVCAWPRAIPPDALAAAVSAAFRSRRPGESWCQLPVSPPRTCQIGLCMLTQTLLTARRRGGRAGPGGSGVSEGSSTLERADAWMGNPGGVRAPMALTAPNTHSEPPWRTGTRLFDALAAPMPRLTKYTEVSPREGGE